MIDSIDLIVKNIKKIDVKHLLQKGIIVLKYKDGKARNSREYFKLNEKIDTSKATNYGYYFEYKDIIFDFSIKHRYLLLLTKPVLILQNRAITFEELQNYKNNITKILKAIIPDFNYEVFVNRIDYKLDIQFQNKEIVKEYLELLKKHDEQFLYTRKNKKYIDSSYLTNKNGQFRFNFYDKGMERLNDLDLQGYKDYENTLRLEVQNRTARMKARANKKEGAVAPTIENYFSEQGMEDNYFSVLSKYLYEIRRLL